MFPVSLLHTNYIKYANGVEVILEEEAIVFNGERYGVEEITSIQMYTTWQRKNNSVGRLAHEEYYYYLKINLKDKHPLIIDSLLGINIDRELKKHFPIVPFQYHFHFIIGLLITEASFEYPRCE